MKIASLGTLTRQRLQFV